MFDKTIDQKRMIIFQEFPCDDITPSLALLSLNAGEGTTLLESAVQDPDMSRRSLLAIEPFAIFSSKENISTLQFKNEKVVFTDNPFERLRETIDLLRVDSSANPLLVGGAIGFMSYDAVRLFEDVPSRHPDIHNVADLFFIFHAVHITFDHVKGLMTISVNMERTKDADEDYRKGSEKIAQIRSRLKKPPEKISKKEMAPASFTEEMNDQEYCEMVKKAKKYIFDGDAFQIVPSRVFSTEFHGDPFDVYRALKLTNPSPFMFYMQTEDFAIAGASPERLVKLENGILQTMPIAGTVPRIMGQEDKSVLKLLQDPKEDAEHMMLVDLGRNDLGKIAKVGTVQVKELKIAKYFAHVIHLVSSIQAEIEEGFDALDCLKATFPAGTLSGAPKIRAMEIIDEIEHSRRGLYGGAICTIDANGNLDSCITIRTAFIKDGMAYVRAGGGVVMDSDPQTEANESRAKAKGVLNAISMAMRGLS